MKVKVVDVGVKGELVKVGLDAARRVMGGYFWRELSEKEFLSELEKEMRSLLGDHVLFC